MERVDKHMMLSGPNIKHVQLNDVDGSGNEIVLYHESTSDDVIVDENNNRLTQFLTTATNNVNRMGDPVCIVESNLEMTQELMTTIENM